MMRAFVAITALAIGVLCSLGNGEFLEPRCGVSPIFKITGGTDADISANPWMAYIHSSVTLICGGALITERFVLTAAHCVQEGIAVKVRLGEYDDSTTEDCDNWVCNPRAEEYDVDMAIRHGKYSEHRNLNDIALLRLAVYVTFKVHIKPICIILDTTMREKFDSVQWFIATGWGETNTNRTGGALQTIHLQRYDPIQCKRALGRPVQQNQFCAGSLGSDTCHGDSGGPLIQNVRHMDMWRAVQFGVISYGSRDCSGIGVYTDVYSYTTWIATVVRQNSHVPAAFMPTI
ncbi:serine protease grass [Drosophila santomea]|uniref:serine protease grass n=1 Tax=Drosophila santomea TaxID=129105 RepID=UPI00195477F0|nr:serine protease grass [Drosophila santomea]